ncbi:MAG: hypothetical protein DWQ51_16200 [Microcystis wesenbergii TW10]|uniref:Uncharacterized protein n=2 Tax=Microcystis TaxID=1125 RepID=A0A552AX64_MICAE|nr:MAG: hypothetical protein DWQ51_16200 [Microcystis wesenbergii TW10]TRT90052.1 MAG: hypothetical protein EWV63_02220 [Microcystis aeruginosa Ma_OC_H_19870700_S124]
MRWQKKDKADFITDVGVKTLAFRDGMKPRPLQNSTSTSSVTRSTTFRHISRGFNVKAQCKISVFKFRQSQCSLKS